MEDFLKRDNERELKAFIYDKLKKDSLLWAHTFFPHHLREETPPFHKEILEAVAGNRFTAIAAPRESSKSTLITFLDNFHDIIFKKKRFLVIVSNTFTKGAMALDAMKKELKENEKLRAVFPGITIPRDAEGDSVIRHPDGFETKVLCKGLEQVGSIRGVKFGAWRPDKIIVDDIEDDKMVKNPDLRQDLQYQYDDALIPAGEKGVVKVVVVGTILHDDSQMAKLVSNLHYPEYKKLIYKAHINPDTTEERSLWPERWTLEWLKELRAKKPGVYAKEYQNDPRAGGLSYFNKKDFRYWRSEFGKYLLYDEESKVFYSGNLSDCKAAIACDLAWEEKKESDSTVIMPGFLTPENYVLIEDYICQKGLKTDQAADLLFPLEARLRKITNQFVPIGLEKGKLEKVLRWFLGKEIRKRNQYLSLRDLSWESDKITRIVTRLEARYRWHEIFHKKNMGDYEEQLVRVPSGVHDDLPDAAQGLIQLFNNPKTQPQPSQPQDLLELIRKHTLRRKFQAPGLFQIHSESRSKTLLNAKVDPLHIFMPK